MNNRECYSSLYRIFLIKEDSTCIYILFGFYRFLQGPETDPATVRKIREAIDNQTDVTVQLINYTKTGVLTFCNL